MEPFSGEEGDAGEQRQLLDLEPKDAEAVSYACHLQGQCSDQSGHCPWACGLQD
jgi:hypothetical protein